MLNDRIDDKCRCHLGGNGYCQGSLDVIFLLFELYMINLSIFLTIILCGLLIMLMGVNISDLISVFNLDIYGIIGCLVTAEVILFLSIIANIGFVKNMHDDLPDKSDKLVILNKKLTQIDKRNQLLDRRALIYHIAGYIPEYE